jgi:hypothetical protein
MVPISGIYNNGPNALYYLIQIGIYTTLETRYVVQKRTVDQYDTKSQWVPILYSSRYRYLFAVCPCGFLTEKA